MEMYLPHRLSEDVIYSSGDMMNIIRARLIQRSVSLDGRINGLDHASMDDKLKSGLSRLESARREITGEKD